MTKQLLLTLLISLLFAFQASYSQEANIYGEIRNNEGEPLSFTTVFIKELNNGTTSNAEGNYEISVAPGTYTVYFQYVGYETRSVTITIGGANVRQDMVLQPQTLVLRDVTVTAGKEDPAYTIMRKAIAKSKFHTQQLDRYTARVYIKGAGKLKNAPFFLRKTLEKEGVELDRVFIQESISDIEYIRPGTYKETVISIRTSGENDENASPNAYINGSFYEPELANSVSPLSPKAFSYYRFEYDGTFKEGDAEISRIRVIPRSKGDNVFTGYIQIIEDIWAIHSLELEVTKLGITFDIRQQYAPIRDEVWLPVTHEFLISGVVFGFDFEGKYLASVSDYDITVNPELDVPLTVIDEKVDKELAEKLEDQVKDEALTNIQSQLADGGEVTNKQLRKLLREYEKQERKEQDEPEIISDRTYKIDSMAYKHDSVYWQSIRPVPLSKEEVIGYAKTDSLAEIQRLEAEGDTLRTGKRKKGFQVYDLLLGDTYRIGDGLKFTIDNISGNFNTVDGFDLTSGVQLTKNFENKSWLSIHPTGRYTFSRKAWNYKLETQYGFGPRRKRNDLTLSAGRYIQQFNASEPIHPLLNTIFSLLGEQNYMKIYEHDFIRIGYSKQGSLNKLKLNTNLMYADRRSLDNTTDFKIFNGKGYTSNDPENDILDSTAFVNHQATTFQARLEWRPWLKYRIYNGEKYPVDNSSPTLSFMYRTGLPDILGSDVEFHQVEASFRHSFKIGIQGFADLAVSGGTFLGNNPEYFMDFQHFQGNQTPFITTDPVTSYRLLNYYKYSTNGSYVSVFAQYQFRKFLLTRFPKIRLMGIREGFFANYLGNEVSQYYTEVGYGINYIFRIIRVEAVAAFQDGTYYDWGVRIGIATNLDDIF
ncbi:DUF5686 and carboxypeptidase regulatory-like domain-containing protein [Fulvivirga sedimenti]|uniref:DUF5686 and carboxypeptidase regulatory-like domain-containing protein n=1 Tax=Fulvivirga sedimenti TaxID=2879465 RepID=A0A9X1HP78_9BACT|nr:DUF5686 and carboxypeptidase regulatory-like domain-containing protein [Fulvivirga sedimenti]MCA6074232.1 DUF5686 and carboxypeptidase regulatory-like domain-containing protein [Fulvivirga sedimenti]